MNIKVLLLAVIALASSGVVVADSKVTTPSGRVTAGLPIPIQIDIEYPNKNFTVEIQSGGNKIIEIKKTGPASLKSISTRFQAIGSEIATSISYEDGSAETHKNFIDLPAPSVIPEEPSIRKSDIGGRVIEFPPQGTEFLIRKGAGVSRILVMNGVSRKHYVNSAMIELTTGGIPTEVAVSGSPYWFEPLIIFSGDFTDSSVKSIVSK